MSLKITNIRLQLPEADELMGQGKSPGFKHICEQDCFLPKEATHTQVAL